ncbi:Beta-arrestin-2, partial [Eschrichtius robustus]|nr:Beta-arrestin-2 [Eschrichtius robustus]
MGEKPGTRVFKKSSPNCKLYYHGETLNVNVHVTNNSTKTVKKIKVSVRQYADICLFSTAQYKCPVAQIEQDDQVSPSSTFCKVYTITPLLSNNREKRGLALDGKLKHEDTNLASSTIVKEGANKEVLGILVSYRVKVKLVVSRGGDVSVELPFVLMHPKPHDHITLPRPQSGENPGVAMATYSLANERLRALEDIEREIGAILQNAGQPHEGSSYSSRKDCQMALKRVDYARLKLSEVARTCEQMLEN